MSQKLKRPVVSARVYQHIKDVLNNKASSSGETLAGYTEKVLNHHCDEDSNTQDCMVNDLKTKLAQKNGDIETLKQEMVRLQKRLATALNEQQHKTDYNAEIDQLKASLNQALQKLQKQNQIIANYKANTTEAPVELSNSARFVKHIEALQKEFPKLKADQLIEAAIACSYNNEGNFFTVYTLKDFLKRNPNFFTIKTKTNETIRS